MKKVRYRDDWIFNVDEKKTRDFYAERMITIPETKEILPEVSAFVEEMGIDIRKPLRYSKDKNDLCFAVFGTAKASAGGYELDFHESEHFVSIVVYAWPNMDDSLIRAIKENEDTNILLFEMFIC